MILAGNKVKLSSDLGDVSADELAHAANSEDIHRFIGAHSFPYPYTREDALFFIRQNRQAGNEVFKEDFAIRHDGVLVGIIGLSDYNTIDRSAHVGYWISSDYRNRGFASESLDLVCSYAADKLNLVRLHTKVMDVNTASLKVLMKNGFKVEGYEIKSFFMDGQFHDMFLLARLL